jgi:hypothetical protein
MKKLRTYAVIHASGLGWAKHIVILIISRRVEHIWADRSQAERAFPFDGGCAGRDNVAVKSSKQAAAASR